MFHNNLVTLREIVVILLPEHEWIQNCVIDLLKTRWAFARSKYIADNGCEPPVKYSISDGKMYAALPYNIAWDNVSKWIPWALFMLSEDLKQVCEKSGDYTVENISIGANAGEEITM